MKLQFIYDFADAIEDFVNRAKTLYVAVNALFVIPLDERCGLGVIHVEALLDSLLVVVAASRLLSAEQKSLHQLVLGYKQLDHCGYVVSALSEHLLQSLCLWDGTRETIEDNTFVFLAETVIYAGQYVYHQLIGDELSLVDIAFGGLAKLCSVLDFVAQYIASGDVSESVLLD